jgi:hypothetical protein
LAEAEAATFIMAAQHIQTDILMELEADNQLTLVILAVDIIMAALQVLILAVAVVEHSTDQQDLAVLELLL